MGSRLLRLVFNGKRCLSVLVVSLVLWSELGLFITSALLAHVLLKGHLPVLVPVALVSATVPIDIVVREHTHGSVCTAFSISSLLDGLPGGKGISLHTCVHLREEQTKDALTILPLEIVQVNLVTEGLGSDACRVVSRLAMLTAWTTKCGPFPSRFVLQRV